MALKGKFIRISHSDNSGFTRIGINGRHRRLPSHEDVAVSDAEMEVLENSHVEFEVKGDAKASDLTEAVDANTDSTAQGATDEEGTQHAAGADTLGDNKPEGADVAVVERPDADPTPAGADHLAPMPEADVEAAREEALEQRDAALAGTAEPAVVLTNTDPNQTGTTTASDLNNEPFDVDTTLGQSIPKITEDMDEFSPEQLTQLLDAEKAGQNRSTLIAAIEKKQAA